MQTDLKLIMCFFLRLNFVTVVFEQIYQENDQEENMTR